MLPAWLWYLPPALAPGLFRTQASRLESGAIMNLTISNVPGPRERGHIEGATVSEICSVGPVVTGSAMNITVWSYVDQLAISALADDLTLDDPHEATDAMIDAFIEIRTAAGLSPDLTATGKRCRWPWRPVDRYPSTGKRRCPASLSRAFCMTLRT